MSVSDRTVAAFLVSKSAGEIEQVIKVEVEDEEDDVAPDSDKAYEITGVDGVYEVQEILVRVKKVR